MAEKQVVDLTIKSLKPAEKDYKFSISDGLYLLVKANGTKCWRLKYRFAKKEKVLSIGVYPVVSLKDAKNKAFEARKMIFDSIDPSFVKSEAKKALLLEEKKIVTFQDVALELIKQKELRCTENYVNNFRRSLEIHIFPVFGDRAVGEITGREVVAACQTAAKSGTYLPHKLAQRVGEVMELAVLNNDREYNPVTSATHKALPEHEEVSFASIEESDLPMFFNKLSKHRGYQLTHLMLLFEMHTFLRTIEVRRFEMSFFDEKEMLIIIPSGKAFNRKNAPVVPVSKQVFQIIKKAQDLTDRSDLVFPMFRDFSKIASENVITQALKSMGYQDKMTGHGFRSLARTTLEEKLGFHSDVCELQLGHKIAKDDTEAAYRRVKFLDERKKMMQAWSDFLDEKQREGLLLDL